MMTVAQFKALVESQGWSDETELDFFSEKVFYGASDTEAVRLSYTKGLHPKAVFVKAAA